MINIGIDNSDDGEHCMNSVNIQQHVIPWHSEMAEFMKATPVSSENQNLNSGLGFRQMLSTSFADAIHPNKYASDILQLLYQNPYLDINSSHYYGIIRNINIDYRYNVIANLKNDYNKPVIYGEFGVIGEMLDQERCTDINIHNNLWSSAFCGSYGAGLNWWWIVEHEPYEPEQLEVAMSNYVNLHNFIKDIDFENIAFTPHRFSEGDINKLDKDDMIEALYLVGIEEPIVIGWVHNASYYWYNYKDELMANCYTTSNNFSNLVNAISDPLNPNYDDFAGFRTADDLNEYPVDLTGFDIELDDNNLWAMTPYLVQFYNTRTGEFIEDEIKQIAMPDYDGKCTITVPPLDNDNPDVAFLMTIYNTKSLISQGDSQQQDIIDYGKFRISPNPSTTGEFKLFSGYQERFKLTVYDTRGSNIFESIIEQGVTNIDLYGHPKGVYCLKLANTKQIKMFKLVIN